jgi:hypothetical protein
MTPRERFVHFVALFAPEHLRSPLVEEALSFDATVLALEGVDEHGDRIPSVAERPMDAAWELVQYRRYGNQRPGWYPRILPPTTQILST